MKPLTEIEHEYVKRRLRSCVVGFTKRLKRASRRNRERVTRGLVYWTQALESHQAGLAHKGADRMRQLYAKYLSNAVRDGRSVGKAVERSDAYARAVENRRRYEKGLHTSFANRSSGVDDSMKAKRGYKAKRQDGKPITCAQLADIAAIVTDIESVMGPLSDLFAKTDITIAHTNGKHPFMRSSGGIYHPRERTISVGVAVGDAVIRAGAHEIAHWLDAEAGAAMAVTSQLSSASRRCVYDSTYLSEVVGSSSNDPEHALLPSASRSINRAQEARRAFSTRATRTVERDRLRASLGPYWYRSCEIFARLVEQWLATKLGRRSSAADSPEVYQRLPGWWTETDFLQLMPAVERSVERRIGIVEGASQGSPDHTAIQGAT